MEKDTYLVLRVSEIRKGGYDPLSYDWRSGTRPEALSEIEYRVETQELDPKDYRELRRDQQVVAAAPSMPLRLIEPVAEPGASAQAAHIHSATWGVYVSGALPSPYAGYGVSVAVLDTGIDAGHEAFSGIELIQKDFTGEGNGDPHGHGTHVAGTIFGQTGQGLRYAVAPGVRRALIGKVMGMQHSTTTVQLVEAIEWAVREGAHIINMSLGIDFPGLVQEWVELGLEVDLATSRALAHYRDNVRFFDALVSFQRARAAFAPAALIVAAAGNESKRHIQPDYVVEASLPAATQGVVAVAALQTASPLYETLAVAPFSNSQAAMAGPGVGIYSAKSGGGYTYMSGTSMASPHVAGVAALWAERQLKHTGMVNIGTLDAKLRASASRSRLPSANYLDVGEGLACAPAD